MSSHHSWPSGRIKPVWDRENRELRIGGIVVKKFEWSPDENQILILNAFEDQGWPPHIDNPLAARRSIFPKHQLRDTLKCLNQKQVNELVKFRSDETGLGVRFEIRLLKPSPLISKSVPAEQVLKQQTNKPFNDKDIDS